MSFIPKNWKIISILFLTFSMVLLLGFGIRAEKLTQLNTPPDFSGETETSSPGEGDVSPSPESASQGKTEPQAIDPAQIVINLCKQNTRIKTAKGKVTFTRHQKFFMEDFFPPFDSRWFRGEGDFTISVVPKKLTLRLYDNIDNAVPKHPYYYVFYTSNGYAFRLEPYYTNMAEDIKNISDVEEPPIEGETETPSETPVEENIYNPDQDSASPDEIKALMKPSGEDAGTGDILFNEYYNPMNLVFPFTFKEISPDAEYVYRGKTTINEKRCYIILLKEPDYGNSLLYITTDDETPHLIQLERLTDDDLVYASATYTPRNFKKGGYLDKEIDIYVYGQHACTFQIDYDEPLNIGTGEDRDKEVGTVQGRKKVKITQIEQFGTVWQVTTVATVLALLGILTFFLYRYWFHKMERIAFGKEVIVVEGSRPEERISHVLEDLGIKTVEFSSELMTMERERLDMKDKTKRPRVLAVAPGMFSKIKTYNFLIKAYIQDGGRVIIFDQGVEQASDMPFTPTFIPYDKTDHNLLTIIMPEWQHIWVGTTPEEINNRGKVFHPYEVLVKVREQNLELSPIIVISDPKSNIQSAAIAMVKENKGEYLLVQYRLFDAIRKRSFASGVAEKMIKDLVNYMVGKEKRIETAPRWVQILFGYNPETSS